MIGAVRPQQSSRMSVVQLAVEGMANADARDRGAIFTSRAIAEFVLDVVGYVVNENLARYRLLEPSFGRGEFLLAAAERLMESYKRYSGDGTNAFHILRDSIRAVEIHPLSYTYTYIQLIQLFNRWGIAESQAGQLADAWLIRDDFLLTDLSGTFTHIVGNPPFVRNERIPNQLWQEYSVRYATAGFRTDLSILFFERSLQLLAAQGKLGFISSDRWLKNQYGSELRTMVANHHHIETFIHVHGGNIFQEQVSAYPVIVIIKQGQNLSAPTQIANLTKVDSVELQALARTLCGDPSENHHSIRLVSDIAIGPQPWIMDLPSEGLELIRRIERQFPSLEEAGCKVRIGVATGCDRVYIGKRDVLPIEQELLLPIVTTKDIRDDAITWTGSYLINPFTEEGDLVNLTMFPLFAQYLTMHQTAVRKRHVAQNKPHAWYRTIDRIYPELVQTPKLLIPDIRNRVIVALDEGTYYPHHNLYFITSTDWDLCALQAVLRSDLSKLFLTTYTVKMRGGYLRCQAQYLRRIRIPLWSSVPQAIRRSLQSAAEVDDQSAGTEATFDLYGLNRLERAAVSTALRMVESYGR